MFHQCVTRSGISQPEIWWWGHTTNLPGFDRSQLSVLRFVFFFKIYLIYSATMEVLDLHVPWHLSDKHFISIWPPLNSLWSDIDLVPHPLQIDDQRSERVPKTAVLWCHIMQGRDMCTIGQVQKLLPDPVLCGWTLELLYRVISDGLVCETLQYKTAQENPTLLRPREKRDRYNTCRSEKGRGKYLRVLLQQAINFFHLGHDRLCIRLADTESVPLAPVTPVRLPSCHLSESRRGGEINEAPRIQ